MGSTDFASVLWPEQRSQDNCQHNVSTINETNVDNKFTRLSVQSTTFERGGAGMNLLPVVTPPPPPSVAAAVAAISPIDPRNSCPSLVKRSGPSRLNKFVRRLHEMLLAEQNSGIVEWRKGLLVLHSTHAFTKNILPKYFGTKNFKTFRRQLNYYGFVHVRSFSATGSTTTALWVNQDLAKRGTTSISSVLMLKRVEPSESSKTAEGRRVRKEEAASTVEDIGINTRTLQLDQIRKLAAKGLEEHKQEDTASPPVIAPRPGIMQYQISQDVTECKLSGTSSIASTTSTSSPVPASVQITVPCPSPTCTAASLIANPAASNSSSNNINININTSIPVFNHMPCNNQKVPKRDPSLNDTSTDDAANLLILLSRSSFSK